MKNTSKANLHRKDPAFLFYPGDYLRDTQCLSEKAQVAYDRIICEHMRNIPITQQQLNFFTKRLNPDELEELLHVLVKDDAGYYIEWVALSIYERRAYSESRRQNKLGRKKDNSCTYDTHMEDANENENINKEEELIADEIPICNINEYHIPEEDMDLVTQLYDVFCEEYKKVRKDDFETMYEGKERKAIGLLLKNFKKKNPDKNTDDCIKIFRNYFNRVCQIQDKFIWENIAPSLIASQYNKIKILIKDIKPIGQPNIIPIPQRVIPDKTKPHFGYVNQTAANQAIMDGIIDAEGNLLREAK